MSEYEKGFYDCRDIICGVLEEIFSSNKDEVAQVGLDKMLELIRAISVKGAA